MPIPTVATILLLISVSSPSATATADELSGTPPSPPHLAVSSHPATLRLPLGHPVDASPGARPGSITTCNRVHIRGLSRLRHPLKFARALKLRLNVSRADGLFRLHTIELCSHRNESLAVGMCPADRWQKLGKSSWVQALSPFEDRILDFRTVPDPSRTIELSTEYEFLLHRLIFLVTGLVMMATARVVSQSVVFYYGSAMTVGIMLVVLMILYQGMRLLPTGRRSSLAIFMYSSVVGVATYMLRYLSGLLRAILAELGISEDMHNPLCIFFLVCLVLAGAWFGYWGVRKLVLTDDGVVDSSVAYFMEWAILIFAAVMILQSSLDPVLAIEALSFAIIILAISRTHRKLKFLRRLFKQMMKFKTGFLSQCSPNKKYHDDDSQRRAKYSKLSPCSSPILGLTKTPPLTEQTSFYSTFHDTPERKNFSKEEWESFTRKQTSKSLTELISSPDFTKWALDNADRITVTPPKDSNRKRQQHRFRWF